MLAFLVGLAIRIADLPYKGTHDMNTYSAWGADVASEGPRRSVLRDLFPARMADLRLGGVGGVRLLGESLIFVLKVVNLAFDLRERSHS